jgi:hypothetical protein
MGMREGPASNLQAAIGSGNTLIMVTLELGLIMFATYLMAFREFFELSSAIKTLFAICYLLS